MDEDIDTNSGNTCSTTPAEGPALLDSATCVSGNDGQPLADCRSDHWGYRACDEAFMSWCNEAGGDVVACDQSAPTAFGPQCGIGALSPSCGSTFTEGCDASNGEIICLTASCEEARCILDDHAIQNVEFVNPAADGVQVQGFGYAGQLIQEFSAHRVNDGDIQVEISVRGPAGYSTWTLVANDVDGLVSSTGNLAPGDAPSSGAPVLNYTLTSLPPGGVADECDNAAKAAVSACFTMAVSCGLLNPAACAAATGACGTALDIEACVCGLISC